MRETLTRREGVKFARDEPDSLGGELGIQSAQQYKKPGSWQSATPFSSNTRPNSSVTDIFEAGVGGCR